MKIKKIILLIIFTFVVTGCTADYELTFEDGVFSEHIVIKEEMTDNSGELFGIMELKNNPDLAKIDDNNSYKYSFSSDGKNNILTLDFVYDDISIDKSLVYNDCFRYRNFIDGEDYYYIKLEGDMACEYLTSANVTFKTDKFVIMSNADEKDEEKGIYEWKDFDGGEIVIQVSKTRTYAENKADLNTELIPWYVKLIISLVVIGVVFIFYKIIKRDHE